MARVLFFIISIACTTTVWAQGTVIWAAEVLDVSSEYGPLEYSALQVLHKPNVLPGGGQNPNSWRPKKSDKSEYIIVEFDTPIIAKQVAIAESENPGAVTAVYAYDQDYNDYLLFELTPTVLPIESRLLNLFFEETSYKIKALRVELSGDQVPGHNALDAIGISASNIPISVLIQVAKSVNPEIPATRLSANVNSAYTEHGPIISPDGKRLYFSRQYHPENTGGAGDPEDIWVSTLDQNTGEWQPATNLGSPLNTKGPNFISSITVVDGKEVLVLGNRYGRNGRMFMGTSMSTYDNGVYSDPLPLEIENDYNYDRKADFFLAAGGEILLISSEREETYGQRDLYVSFKKGELWSEPRNLGGDINTIAMETAPFLAGDADVLYFSSAGHTGYGASDIYVSRRLDDSWSNWSPPENLGAAVNTSFDDEYFSIPTAGKNLFFARSDVNENMDIFTFRAEDFLVSQDNPLFATVAHLLEEEPTIAAVVEDGAPPSAMLQDGEEAVPPSEKAPKMVVVLGTIRDASSKKILDSTSVNIERLPDGIVLGEIEAGEKGEFAFALMPGAKYSVVAEKDGFLAQSEIVDLDLEQEIDSLRISLLLQPIEKGRVITMRNIFFDFDTADFKTSAYVEMHRIIEFLTNGDIQRIEVSGHTDSVGEEDYNLELSERRATMVANYFVSKGVSADRIAIIGHGESAPVATNSTKEGRQQNRRVEFRILEVN